MLEYYNGRTNVQVNDLDYLNNLSQDELNRIATGPQDEFLSYMSRINNELNVYGIEPIDITGKWNWKPGTYDKIKEYLGKRMDLHKKARDIHGLVYRTKTKVNYLGYFERQARTMEMERFKLKHLGISRNVDTAVFQELCNEFTNKIIEQCDIVAKTTDGKVKLTPYVDISEPKTMYYLDIVLSDLVLEVYNGSKVTNKIPLDNIHIVAETSFRHLLNDMMYAPNFTGKYMNDFLKFPYISVNRYGNNYGTVCLDNYSDDVRRAFKNSDYLSMAMLLMQWAQYYNTSYSNPYNQPYLLHYGMPENVLESYTNLYDYDMITSHCNSYLNDISRKESISRHESNDYKLQKCKDIKCKFIDSCDYNWTFNKHVENIRVNNEVAEGIVGLIMEHLSWKVDNSDVSNSTMSNVLEGITGYYLNPDIEDYLNEWMQKLHYYICSGPHGPGNNWVYDYIHNNNLIEKVESTEEKVMSNEEIETLMKQWVSTQ